MAQVYVSIGSNIDRERHICAGVADLRQRFGALTLSSIYESEAVGFDGDNFYNLVAAFETEFDPFEVAAVLREIENRHGRTRTGPRFSSRTLDIDLLLYDDAVLERDGVSIPRNEITRNAFVLLPLAEIAPERRHPVSGERFADLWDRFDRASQSLWPVALAP